MTLDSVQILKDLMDAFGEGEVSLMSYDFHIGNIELRLVALESSVSHRFTKAELDTATPAVFNRIYKQLFALLSKEIKIRNG